MSEFWDLVDDEFGALHGRSLIRDQVLAGVGYRTAQQALDRGDEPREVWAALCDEMDVPAARRWGRDEMRRRT